ncbi:MAG: tRNA (adenosine(37)-N6)-threonylcarbamoyltransferase complex dimerization subunit type 1 TsaB [Magnetospirillum sp.]|nr:tRNA (adenosine(37)-N6)-threonylcarbamoyltransferase complex dimerization subunit type 1 TsaB [Magnetospirillum sp.]
MRLLAIDSATSACSAALWAGGAVLARRHRPMARGQSEALVPMIAEVMADSGLSFADLDLLAVTVGPGAFTGIRIGLATARGLALAAGLPVAGITTTEAVAAAVPPAERGGRTVLVALDSKREDVWVQAFAPDLSALCPIQSLAPEAAAALVTGPALVVGDAAGRVLPLMTDALAADRPGWPDAAVVAALAARRWADGQALPPEPLYLRPADVTLPPAGPA